MVSKKITSTSRLSRLASEKKTDSCTRSEQQSRKSIARYSSSSETAAIPNRTTSRPSQRVASSFEAGSKQRWQTIAKIARSTPERPRPPPARRATALPIPSSRQSASSTCGPPASGAAMKRKPSGVPARSVSSLPRKRPIERTSRTSASRSSLSSRPKLWITRATGTPRSLRSLCANCR